MSSIDLKRKKARQQGRLPEVHIVLLRERPRSVSCPICLVPGSPCCQNPLIPTRLSRGRTRGQARTTHASRLRLQISLLFYLGFLNF